MYDFKKKGRLTAVHMTIRDVDCHDFDSDQFVTDMKKMHVDLVTFFAGGYVTAYPSKLKYQRISPYLDRDADIVKDLSEKLSAAGIVPVATIDLSIVPQHAVDDHPDWAWCDEQGNTERVDNENLYSCLLGGWHTEYAKEIVAELLANYKKLGGIKFGGGSYGFASDKKICHCPNCKREFKKATGLDLPYKADWKDATYKEYINWRYEVTSRRVKELYEMVKSFDENLLVMGNSVCFGAPAWTMKSSLDQEHLVKYQDIVQIEAQDRTIVGTDRDNIAWQSFMWSSEEANYMASITDRPVIIVASYFLAWPWRRSAMEYAEQKFWYYQMISNGANPMVNLSGGPPKVHEDKRGFRAIEEVYGFYKENMKYYENDSSCSEIAIVYSQSTLVNFGKHENDAMKKYVSAIRGMEQVLLDYHMTFDIVSIKALAQTISKYRVVILPNTACLSDEEAQMIREYVKKGGNIIATASASLYDEKGNDRKNYLLQDVLGISYKGKEVSASVSENGLFTQCYGVMAKNNFIDYDLGTEIVPIDHHALEFSCGSANALLTRSPAFRVFPECLSYPKSLTLKTDDVLVSCNNYGNGKAVYFGWQIDRQYYESRQNDLGKILSDTIKELAPNSETFEVIAPKSVISFVRRQSGRVNVHLLNYSGAGRIMSEVVFVQGIRITLPKSLDVKSVFLLKQQQNLDIMEKNGERFVEIPCLTDYDVCVFNE